MPSFVDLTGKRFGLLIAQSRNFDGPKPRWNCLCDCGNSAVMRPDYLKSASVPSCGCYTATLTTRLTHGMSCSAEYRTWVGMKARCYKPSSAAYYKYGARGIKVCERWQCFENFYADMGQKPSPKHTLDRIDGTGDYTPENCRWATLQEQQRNLKNNVRLDYDGKSLTVGEWAEIVGLAPKTIDSRIRLQGWTVEEALTLPLHFHHKHKVPRRRRADLP